VVFELGCHQQRVERQHHEAGLERSEVGGKELRHVRQLQPHDLPGKQAISRRPAAKRPDCRSRSRYVSTVPPARVTGASGEAIAVSARMVARLKLIRSPSGIVARGAIYISETYIKCIHFLA